MRLPSLPGLVLAAAVAVGGSLAGGTGCGAAGWRDRGGLRGGAGGAGVVEDPVLSAHLRKLVGTRTRAPAHQFAREALAGLGVRLRPELALAPTGEALVSAARTAGALSVARTPAPGDLVVFEEGWLVGVVTAVRGDGAVEFVYAARGVVRRGWLAPTRPSDQRDPEGRILNTFVRPRRPADTRGQRYLAGELYTGLVRAADATSAPSSLARR
jgi:hypothetical protein